MSEIRDKVRFRIKELVAQQGAEALKFQNGVKSGDEYWQDIDRRVAEILSIPELAIVDREAELPDKPKSLKGGHTKQYCLGYMHSQFDMQNAGWLQEEKE